MGETAAAQRIADVGMSARKLGFAAGEGGRADHRPAPLLPRAHRRPSRLTMQPGIPAANLKERLAVTPDRTFPSATSPIRIFWRRRPSCGDLVRH